MRRSRHSSGFEEFVPIIALGVFALIAILIYIIDKRRKGKIKEYSKRNGFVYTEDPPAISAYSETFNIFDNSGHTSNFYSNMHKKIGNIEIDVTDYQYITGHGKHRASHNFTICQICSPDAFFPQFFIRDEDKIFDTLGSLLGGQDIDFIEDKGFSDKFVLQGINEGDLRSFFKFNVRRAFTVHHVSGLKYEGIGQHFIIYRSGFSNIDKRLVMIERGLKIFRAITQESSSNSQSFPPQEGFGNKSYASNPFSNPDSHQNYIGF